MNARSLESLITAYLSDRKLGGAAAKSLVKYTTTLTEFAAWAGDRTAGDVTGNDLRLGWLPVWYEHFQARNGREPEPRTVNSMIDTLAGFYFWLDKMDLLVDANGQIARNPVLKLDKRKVKQRLRPWLEAAELVALVEAARIPEQRFCARWLALTGVRIESDVVRVMDVSPDADRISVAISKTSRGARTIPIDPKLKPFLAQHLEWMQQQRWFGPQSPILCTQRGTPMKQQQAERWLKEMAARAGLAKSVSPQMLRRTAGSLWLNAGVRLETVSRLLGHESVATTGRYYAEMLPETLAAEFFAAM